MSNTGTERVSIANEVANAEARVRAELYRKGIEWIASRKAVDAPEDIIRSVQNAGCRMMAYQFGYSERAVWKRVKEVMEANEL